MARPDFSDYVVHFTKKGSPFGLTHEDHKDNVLLKGINTQDARGRLRSILNENKINVTPMPWLNAFATCFTECTWASLLHHARQYSSYGIGFSKSYLFNKGGGPVFYLRPDLFEEQKNYFKDNNGNGLAYCKKFASFLTPFAPKYADANFPQNISKVKTPLDFSHEREWRLTEDLTFNYSEISFVIVADNSDLSFFSGEVSKIGTEKFLIMKNYEQVEKFWPVHLQSS